MSQRRPFGVGYIIADQHGQMWLYTLRNNRSECWRAFLGKTTRKERDFWKSKGHRCVFVVVEESVTAQSARTRALQFIEEHFSAPVNYTAQMEVALIRLIRGEEWVVGHFHC